MNTHFMPNALRLVGLIYAYISYCLSAIRDVVAGKSLQLDEPTLRGVMVFARRKHSFSLNFMLMIITLLALRLSMHTVITHTLVVVCSVFAVCHSLFASAKHYTRITLAAHYDCLAFAKDPAVAMMAMPLSPPSLDTLSPTCATPTIHMSGLYAQALDTLDS